ncbi:MAG: hypothetical protein P4M13_04925, partial [Alphaproteobacteria bacterium]|nr:hypothetical protein [Alphaproteobacteria bacterium]
RRDKGVFRRGGANEHASHGEPSPLGLALRQVQPPGGERKTQFSDDGGRQPLPDAGPARETKQRAMFHLARVLAGIGFPLQSAKTQKFFGAG